MPLLHEVRTGHVSSLTKERWEQNRRLRKQMAFALEIDKEKNIFRQTSLSGHGRKENDAEHDVDAQKVYQRQKKTALGSERLFELTDGILQENIRKGNLKDPVGTE